ncbi:MAG: branched-chain amino acid ABC transporter permease [Methanobacteriota archaeon]|nr:MAG: branched-chain amino acid ABC transporter permease [Euryarchaeota archaeon]
MDSPRSANVSLDMSSVSEANPPAETPRLVRWREALRPTPRFRRQVLRAIIVAVIFLAFLAGLAALFGISILQYTLAGFRLSSIVIVAAIGLTVIYGIRGFANFAYGDLMTLGAYVALFVNMNLALSLIWGAIVSFLALAFVGILLEVLVFARLEGRGPVPPIVASVGVGLIIQNGINWGGTTQQWIFRLPAIAEIPIVPGIGFHWIRDFGTFVVGIGFMLSVHILLTYTNLGKAMRATADNLELAKATGINTKRVTYAAWALSCSFASTAGILLGLIGVLSPTMGFNVLLLIFAAVIVGGIGSPYGAVLGGLVIGLSQEMSVPLLIWLERPDVLHLEHSTAYKVAIPFIVMIGVLIFRPWGIAGRPPAFARRVFFMERITKVLGRRGDAREQVRGEGGG